LRLLGPPAGAGVRHDTQVTECQRSGEGGTRPSIGNIVLADDDQRGGCYPRRQGFEVCGPDLVEKIEHIRRPGAQLLHDGGGQQVEDAVVKGTDQHGLQVGVGAQHECGDQLPMSSGNL
jgi:hypothetical protein